MIGKPLNILKVYTELLNLYKEPSTGGPSRLEQAIGKDAAIAVLKKGAQAVEKHLNPSILPWQHDVADAQRIMHEVLSEVEQYAAERVKELTK